MLMCDASPTALARACTRGLLEQQHAAAGQREHYYARVHREGRVDHQQRTARDRRDHPASVLTNKYMVRPSRFERKGGRTFGRALRLRRRPFRELAR
jgi:hypothetical protein